MKYENSQNVEQSFSVAVIAWAHSINFGALQTQ